MIKTNKRNRDMKKSGRETQRWENVVKRKIGQREVKESKKKTRIKTVRMKVREREREREREKEKG
jgi:hypothetical protein